jgi:hypothetical protein
VPDDPKTGSRAQTEREARRRQAADKEQATGAQQEEDFERAEAAEKQQASNDSARTGPLTNAGSSFRNTGGTKRKIVGAIAFSVLFAVLGIELEGTKSAPAKQLATTPTVPPKTVA